MKKHTLLMMMAILLLSFSPTILNAGNIKKSDTTTPVVNVASADEMALLARPEELKSIDQITVTAPESAGLVTDAKPVMSDQYERRRRHHNNDGVYVDNGRYHHGTVIYGVGGGVLLIILLIVLL